jgi:hypothetical protein
VRLGLSISGRWAEIRSGIPSEVAIEAYARHAGIRAANITPAARPAPARVSPCVAPEAMPVHAGRMSNSRNPRPRKHAASVHFDEDLWARVALLAEQERRPVSQLLRNLVADAVNGRSDRGQSAAGGSMEAA